MTPEQAEMVDRLANSPPMKPIKVEWGSIIALREMNRYVREQNDPNMASHLALTEKIAGLDSQPLLLMQITTAGIEAIKAIAANSKAIIKKPETANLVRSDLVGRSLALFSGQAATAVGEWETAVSSLLEKSGFQRVYTHYMYKKDSYLRYKDWLGEQEFLFFPEPEEGASEDVKHIYKECRNLLPMGHKGLNHAIMFQEGRLSFRELPVSYFEIAQIYTASKDGPINELGLYLSMFCHPDVMDMGCASIYSAIAECGITHKKIRLVTHKIRSGVAPEGDLRYVTATNDLANGGLILARARFQYNG
jgi:hypothetical protein